jgi:hypothetical protein
MRMWMKVWVWVGQGWDGGKGVRVGNVLHVDEDGAMRLKVYPHPFTPVLLIF